MGEGVDAPPESFVGGQGQIEAVAHPVGVDPDQVAEDVDHGSARRSTRQGCGVLDGASHPSAPGAPEGDVEGRHEAHAHADAASPGVGQGQDGLAHPDRGTRHGQRRSVSGVHRHDGEVALHIDTGGPTVGTPAVGEGHHDLLTSKVVGVGDHEPVSHHHAAAPRSDTDDRGGHPGRHVRYRLGKVLCHRRHCPTSRSASDLHVLVLGLPLLVTCNLQVTMVGRGTHPAS